MIKTWLKHKLIEVSINTTLDGLISSFSRSNCVRFEDLTISDIGKDLSAVYNGYSILAISDNWTGFTLVPEKYALTMMSDVHRRIQTQYGSSPFWIKAYYNQIHHNEETDELTYISMPPMYYPLRHGNWVMFK